MAHLSDLEFVDYLDDALPASRAGHVSACADCRARAETLRQALVSVTADAHVPEPSPLFWEHFSARVREEIAAEPPHRASAWWAGAAAARLAAAFALVAVVATGVSLLRDSRTAESTAQVAREHATPAAVIAQNGDADAGVDPANAEVWAVLTAAASDMAIEEARDAGMEPLPAAVDRAVQDMSAAELNELGRLLQSELKRTGN